MKILFIGNSHTYFNDMPHIVSDDFMKQKGIYCETTMLSHGGWTLRQHAEEPQTRFNIIYGGYDYVVLQDKAHPFEGPVELIAAANALNAFIRSAGSVPVAYMTWTKKGDEASQAEMSAAYTKMADEIGAVLAPVGEKWYSYMKEHPDAELYAEDGQHASMLGSSLVAQTIVDAIMCDRESGKR